MWQVRRQLIVQQLEELSPLSGAQRDYLPEQTGRWLRAQPRSALQDMRCCNSPKLAMTHVQSRGLLRVTRLSDANLDYRSPQLCRPRGRFEIDERSPACSLI